ncbi:MAG: glycine cleavage system aminomethyltransferase GcvT [Gammaproteobacteria bacterium]
MALDHETLSVPLESLHRELGAKMVPFAGYRMPVSYPGGIISEHKHTRKSASFFDISHMGQIRITGPDVATALESLVPGDLSGLPVAKQRYTVFTNESAGILDDLMVTHAGDHYFLVVNASRKEADLRHLLERMPQSCEITMLTGQSLFALQGPEAVEVMERVAPGAEELDFLSAGSFLVAGTRCFISRSGYTGEDGFEISVPASGAERVARNLLEQPEVAPAGLGARDSLRLEAGLCLYGHELDESTTPVEASLSWVVAKRYLREPKTACFPGAAPILEQIRSGAARKRVGLLPEGKALVREGAEILNANDQVVGRVTSGGFGPSLGVPLAMAILNRDHAVEGGVLSATVRNKRVPVRVATLPFVKHHYCSK